MVTAADVQAVAESVMALAVVIAGIAWLRHAPGRLIGWRKRKRRDEILGYVIPVCLVVLTVTLSAIQRGGKDSP